MEMRAAASELHVAQQSRRDKLRIQYQQSSTAAAPSSSLLNHFDHPMPAAAAAPASFLNHYDHQIAAAAAYPNNLPPEEILNFSTPNSNTLSADSRWKLLGPPQEVSYPVSSIPYLTTFSSNEDGYDHHQTNQNQLQQSLALINPGLTTRHYGEMQLDSPPPQRQQLYQNSTYNGNNDAAAGAAIWMDRSTSKSEGFPIHPHSGALALSLSSNPWGSSSREIQVSVHPNAVGPLGPFTGYATILKSSKFLRPAQNLLDEFCALIGSTNDKLLSLSKPCGEFSGPNDDDEDASAAGRTGSENIGDAKALVRGHNNDNCVSSSLFYGSNQMCGDAATSHAGSSSSDSCLPDYQHKKATLLYMQEEVCRRYRQYHQQMQLVVSSFESVAGLSAAAPYISLALKTISRHFRSLKNAISNQLRQVRKALGENTSSPSSGNGGAKGDGSTSRLKYIEQKFHKHKPGGVDAGFLEPQQHIWRPQRGLPERSVAILRAWLFDHFLHPYPTDSDKHMLATQTGLSRNQVSNWFINARVRVWKPMVEEIHMLETKGIPTEPGLSSGKNDGKSAAKDGSQANNDPSLNPSASLNVVSVMPDKRLDSCGMGPSEGTVNLEQYWNQDKRARVECPTPTSMDGALIGFGGFDQGGGGNVRGMGAVSLTLGLRNNEVESSQQQLQQQEHRLRQHFGGHMIHDFVG